ncbi:MAG: hypothetical protein Q4A80_01420 [Bacillota bacterium]|nr:hypothetical protein [Bacillota bacterium]
MPSRDKKENQEKFFEKGEKRRKNKKPGLTAYLKTSSQTGLFLGGAGKDPGEARDLLLQN